MFYHIMIHGPTLIAPFLKTKPKNKYLKKITYCGMSSLSAFHCDWSSVSEYKDVNQLVVMA